MARREDGSRDFLETAAQGGAPDALLELGLRYCNGLDVEPDYVAAHKWFNLAALRGNLEAKRYRAELSREMSKAQIVQAQREARAWLSAH